MKLPLVTTKKSGSVFHVLKICGNDAIGVCESSLKIERIPFNQLDVLSETEYQKWKRYPTT